MLNERDWGETRRVFFRDSLFLSFTTSWRFVTKISPLLNNDNWAISNVSCRTYTQPNIPPSHHPLAPSHHLPPPLTKRPQKRPKIPPRPFQHITLQASPIPPPILVLDPFQVRPLPVEAHEAGDEEFGAVAGGLGREGLVQEEGVADGPVEGAV